MKKLTTFIFILLVLDVAMILFARFFWAFDLFTNYIIQFTFISTLCIAALAIQKRFALSFVLAILTLYIGLPLRMMIPFTHASTHDATVFTVLQANVNYTNTSYTLLSDQVIREKPDVILLEETDREWIDAIISATEDRYPYEIESLSHAYRGMAILSKYPFSNVDRFELSEEESPILRFDIPEYDTTFIALHTLSPVSSAWSAKRDAMLAYVAEMSKSIPGKLIVFGDLNSTIHTTAFQGMLEISGLKDGRRGFGWKPSWMYGTPLAVAIDHILYKGDIFVADVRVLDDIGSDHRPVMAEIGLET